MGKIRWMTNRMKEKYRKSETVEMGQRKQCCDVQDVDKDEAQREGSLFTV